MEFEQLILAALQTKFTGVDAKILGRIAKKYAKTATGTTEADAKTIVDGITFQQVLESHADYRATEAQKTAVANYESKHNLRDGKPIEQPQQQQNTQSQASQQEQGGLPAGAGWPNCRTAGWPAARRQSTGMGTADHRRQQGSARGAPVLQDRAHSEQPPRALPRSNQGRAGQSQGSLRERLCTPHFQG